MSENIPSIRLTGASTHNLKHLDLEIPLEKIVCIAGPSGSGKSSLAFHTLLAESKRRIINSYPNSLKFFGDRPAPVDVESIYPVKPAFGLSQYNPIIGARQSAIDLIGLSEVLARIFAKRGLPICPTHQKICIDQDIFGALIKAYRSIDEKSKVQLFIKKTEYLDIFPRGPWPSRGLIENQIVDFVPECEWWEIARFRWSKRESQNQALTRINGEEITSIVDKEQKYIKRKVEYLTCPECDYQAPPKIHPGSYSASSAIGACSTCSGHGAILEYSLNKIVPNPAKSLDGEGVAALRFKKLNRYTESLYREFEKREWDTSAPLSDYGEQAEELILKGDGKFPGVLKLLMNLERKKYKTPIRVFLRKMQEEIVCPSCNGARVVEKARSRVLGQEVKDLAYGKLLKITIGELAETISFLKNELSSDAFLNEEFEKISDLLNYAMQFGLGHIEVNRRARDLSSSEYQRMLLLKFLSFQGTDCLFVLDEPSLGLAHREKVALIKGLKQLREQGNTVVIIEHDPLFFEHSDHFIEMGPGPGHRGGKILFHGRYSKPIEAPCIDLKKYTPKSKTMIKLVGPSMYGNRFQDIELGIDGVNWIHGEAGSGKSSAIINTLSDVLYEKVFGELLTEKRGQFNKLIVPKNYYKDVQVFTGHSKRRGNATVGSLTELTGVLRKYFVRLPAAKALSLKEGHFSENSQLGRCSACEGKGKKIIEMQFFEDVELPCEYCEGKKLKPEYANLTDSVASYHEYYTAPIEWTLEKIGRLTPKFQRMSQLIKRLGLSHLSLDRSVKQLSGGEFQRLNFLTSICKNPTNAFFVLENLSFGLSVKELIPVCELIVDLAAQKNTIVIIDQNPIFLGISNYQLEMKNLKNTIKYPKLMQ